MDNKPVSIIIEEAKQSIVKTINEQNISPSIMVYVIKEIYEATMNAHRQEYEQDRASWDAFLASEKEKDGE